MDAGVGRLLYGGREWSLDGGGRMSLGGGGGRSIPDIEVKFCMRGDGGGGRDKSKVEFIS